MTLRRIIPSPGIGTGNQVNPVSVTTLLDGYAYVRYVANAAALESVNYPNIGNTWWTNRTTLPKGLTAGDQTAPIIAGYPTVTGVQAWEVPAINRLSGSVEYNESGTLEIFAEPSFTVWNPEDREVAGQRAVHGLPGAAGLDEGHELALVVR